MTFGKRNIWRSSVTRSFCLIKWLPPSTEKVSIKEDARVLPAEMQSIEAGFLQSWLFCSWFRAQWFTTILSTHLNKGRSLFVSSIIGTYQELLLLTNLVFLLLFLLLGYYWKGNKTLLVKSITKSYLEDQASLAKNELGV